MNLEAILQAIAALDGPEVFGQLRKIEGAAKERQKVLAQAQVDKITAEAWTRYRRFKPGITVWCHATGVFMGGPLQRGDTAIVEHVQPRARRLWLKIKGKRYWFEGHGAARYDLKTVQTRRLEPEAQEHHDTMRQIADRLGEPPA